MTKRQESALTDEHIDSLADHFKDAVSGVTLSVRETQLAVSAPERKLMELGPAVFWAGDGHRIYRRGSGWEAL